LKIVRRHAAMSAWPKATALSGITPKARVLLLCARIGYTPHTCFQR
jgi:hypothetical protein